MVKANADKIIDVLKTKKTASLGSISKQVGISKNDLLNSAKYLEEDGIVKINHGIGGSSITLISDPVNKKRSVDIPPPSDTTQPISTNSSTQQINGILSQPNNVLSQPSFESPQHPSNTSISTDSINTKTIPTSTPPNPGPVTPTSPHQKMPTSPPPPPISANNNNNGIHNNIPQNKAQPIQEISPSVNPVTNQPPIQQQPTMPSNPPSPVPSQNPATSQPIPRPTNVLAQQSDMINLFPQNITQKSDDTDAMSSTPTFQQQAPRQVSQNQNVDPLDGTTPRFDMNVPGPTDSSNTVFRNLEHSSFSNFSNNKNSNFNTQTTQKKTSVFEDVPQPKEYVFPSYADTEKDKIEYLIEMVNNEITNHEYNHLNVIYRRIFNMYKSCDSLSPNESRIVAHKMNELHSRIKRTYLIENIRG